jgi:hypothetical protein
MAEEAFSEFTTLSRRFSELVSGKPVVLFLVHDYGMGAIMLCRKARGIIEWAEGYPKK